MAVLPGQSFERGIESLSKQSSQDNAYPRPDLISLSDYLNNPVYQPLSNSRATTVSDDPGDSKDSFLVTYNVATGQRESFSASTVGMVAFSTLQSNLPNPSILFMRGFPTAGWLTTIGQTCSVDPELYRRHLDFYAFTHGRRNLYSSQPLPSSSSRVFQLTISTLCKRNNIPAAGYEPEDLQAARRSENDAMTRYFQQLRMRANPADSIVRNCLLLSRQEYVLEQVVTITVSPSSDGWHAIVWMDNGRDLSQSAPGPWYPQPGTRPWETYFSPVVVNSGVNKIPTLKTQDGCEHLRKDAHSENCQRSGDLSAEQETWRAGQNVCLLPFQYGSLILDRDLARGDALYSLSELFLFAASAEAQLLSFIGQRIEHEISFTITDDIKHNRSVLLLNLKYIKALLASHAQSIAETTGILRNRHSLDWPRIDGNSAVDKIATLLLADFEYLLQKVHRLAHECEQGMTTLANSAVLEESRRSVEMAKTVQKLTIISTVFIPLSFVCSVWGMNFEEFGSGKLPMWMFAASLAPTVIMAYVIYNWTYFYTYVLSIL